MSIVFSDDWEQEDGLATISDNNLSIPEQRLWQRLIVLLLTDARGKAADISNHENKKQLQKTAIKWFLENGDDFHEVCSLAGLKPEWVRSNIIKVLLNEGVIE